MDNKVLSRFRGVSFDIDKFGIRQENSYVHLLGKKITEKEFNQAFNKQLSRAKNY